MNRILLILSFFVVTATCFAQKESGLATINMAKSKEVVAFLASDVIEGREAGTRGATIIADYIAAHFYGLSLKSIDGKEALTLEGYYQQFDTTKLTKAFAPAPQNMKLNNIIGMLEGENSNEIVIIGCHYDHYGIRNGEIYNGADDNASGVSAVLQIANAFVKSGVKPKRTVIFALWDGEEKGLLGSEHFVKNYENLDIVKAYLNFDMIGRNSDEENPKNLTFFYTAQYKEYEQWTREDIITYSLNIDPSYNAWAEPTGGSDNASFAKRGIPILWYHTGGHPDYHKPTDTYDKINWDKLLDITKSAYLNMWHLAND